MMLENVRLAPDITWRSLAMVPLVGDDAPAADYVPLDEALAGGRVTITEVSDAGRVPELCVVNDGDRAVLIVDGEELVGAKQNRIVNLSILVPARSRLVIPVSCVEAGRWAWRSKRFEAAPHAHYTSGRALKALHVTEALATTGSRIADQLSVWENVSAMSSRLGVASPTAASEALYLAHEAALEEAVAALAPVAHQRGAVFLIDGRAVGLELFDTAAAWRALQPKIVRSSAIEALAAERLREQGFGGAGPARDPGACRAAAERFVRQVAEAATARFPAVGAGEDVRLTAEGLAGGALVVDGRVVHLAAFAVPGGGPLASGRRSRRVE